MVEITNGNGHTYARIGVKTLAAVAIALLSYVGGGVWWAATVTERLDHIDEVVARIDTSDRYRGSDAMRDWDYHLRVYHKER